MCSLAARGLWIDLIGYMHEGEPYGHLTVNGAKPSIEDIAALVGRPLAETRKAIAELEARQVYSVDDSGSIYSRRMVRDKAKAEQDRKNGKGGGNPKLKGGDKPGVNPPDKAHIPESIIQNPDQGKGSRAGALGEGWVEGDRERFWEKFPNKVGKAAAMLAFTKATRKVAPDVLFAALHRYVNKADDRAWCNPTTWLNQERWKDQPATAPRSTGPPRRLATQGFESLFQPSGTIENDSTGDQGFDLELVANRPD
jgi:hypothetical protein